MGKNIAKMQAMEKLNQRENSMGKSTEVMTVPESAIQVLPKSPMEMAQSFFAAGGDPDTLREMMALQKEHDAYQAKKAYTKAMAEFKANPPRISKDKNVSYGNTNYNHASLGNVTGTINAALGKHGLTAAWPLDQSEKIITVTCTITHELGHSESTALSAAHDTSGQKNAIQAMGSTISYLQRYTILAMTGLATDDQDDDGATSDPVKFIDEKQASQILDMINSIDGYKVESFTAWAKIESVEEMPSYDFGRCLNALKAKAEASKNAD